MHLSPSYCIDVDDENAPATSLFDPVSFMCFEAISTSFVVGLINCPGLAFWSTSTVEVTLNVFHAKSS